MGRRSNSILPADPSGESTDLVPRPEPVSALVRAGQIADKIAARRVFEDYNERVSANTRRQHEVGLASFTDYLTDAGLLVADPEQLAREPASWSEITWGLVKGYARWLLNQGYAIRTVNTRLSTIRVYCKLAHEAGFLSPSQYSRIRLVKGYSRKEGKRANEERQRKEIPTRVGPKKEEATTISEAFAQQLKEQPDTPKGRRDRLLMCLLLDHGLRCSEVAALQVEDFDVQNGIFRFYRPKVDLVQLHRMTPDTLRAVRAYMALDALSSGPLLRGSNKHNGLRRGGMTTRAVTKRVKVLGRILGLESLSPHDCRHYWATVAVRNGTHVKDLQDAGGWASPAMPLQYAERSRIANQGVKLK